MTTDNARSDALFEMRRRKRVTTGHEMCEDVRNGWVCTLSANHDGEHRGYVDSEVRATWTDFGPFFRPAAPSEGSE